MTAGVPAPAPPEIRLVDLAKHFREVRAVDDVSLEIRRGRVLLAPRAVGLRQDHDPADDRRLRAADGRPRRAARPGRHRRPTGQAAGQHGLPELRAVPPSRRGEQHRVRPQAQARAPRTRSPGGPRRRSSSSTSPATGKRKPNQLSGGQQQRVALARALVNRPNVLLLDEPLGALDLKLRKRLQIELKRIQTEVGITFVYVTHDQEEALTMSDRIAVMNHGKVEQLGTPEELYDRPTTRFVADFIGTTNLLARARSRRSARRRDGAGSTPAIAAAIGATGRAAGQAVDLSLRPEAVAIRRQRWRRTRDRTSGHGRAGRLPRQRRSIPDPHRGGLAISILSAKTGPTAASRRQRVALSWSPDRGARPRRPAGEPGGDDMNDEHDGSSIDLESAALVRYMAERRITPPPAARADGGGRRDGRPGTDHRGLFQRRRPPRRPPPATPAPRRRPRPAALAEPRDRDRSRPPPTPGPDAREGALRLQLG